jgi:hypothetical protein
LAANFLEKEPIEGAMKRFFHQDDTVHKRSTGKPMERRLNLHLKTAEYEYEEILIAQSYRSATNNH